MLRRTSTKVNGLIMQHENSMLRRIVLTAIIVTGTVAIAISASQALRAPTLAALNATKIEKVKDNLYVISGSGVENFDTFSGGNTAVFITEGGVVVVDTKLPGCRSDQDGHQQAGYHDHQYAHAQRSHRKQRVLRSHHRDHRP